MAFDPVIIIRNSTQTPSVVVKDTVVDPITVKNFNPAIIIQSTGAMGPPGQRMILLGGFEGQVLAKASDADGDIAWVDSGPEGIGTHLAHLVDVQIIDPEDGDGLVYNASLTKWTNEALSTVAFTGEYPDLLNKPVLLAFSGTTKISVGTTPPDNPNIGDLWVDTN